MDYEQLSKISGYTTYLQDNYTSSVSSGYTNATSFVIRVNLVAGTSLANILNSCTLFVHFGDGHVEQITDIKDSNLQSQPHYYKWPGVYETKLSVVSNDGVSSVTFNNTLNIINYLRDNLSWIYTNWEDLSSVNLSAGAVFHGYQSCKPGNLNSNTPLSFRFTCSTTLSDQISFDLYSQGSSAQPYSSLGKYNKLRPQWRFEDIDGNIVTNVLPISSQIVPVYLNKDSTTYTDPNSGILVGYEGTLDFYYIDDIPSLTYNNGNYSVNTPILWVTLNTKKFNNLQDQNSETQPSFSNSTVYLSSKFYVKNLSADHLNLSINGGSISLPEILWPGVSSLFFVTVNSSPSSDNIETDYSNKNLLNYPINYSNSNIETNCTPVNVLTFDSTQNTLSRYDNLNRDIGGFLKKTFAVTTDSVLLSSSNITVTLFVSAASATVILEPPADALSGYNPFTRVAATGNNTLQVLPLTGAYTFTIKDFDRNYFIRKINEGFNYGEQLLTYALQPTISKNENLFLLLSAMAGDSYCTDNTFGTTIYEKISNFVLNTQDVQTSNLTGLYSLAKLINTEFDNYKLNYPPSLQKIVDLCSVPHEQLWGERSKYNTNFDNTEGHNNLGTSLTAYNISTDYVSAGEKIVLNDVFNPDFFELLEVPVINSYASVTAAGVENYHFTSGMVYPISVYPLSAFFGWGVKTPVKDYYKFWYYKNEHDNTTTNNIIDWNPKDNGASTTLSESVSSITEWYRDGGILETIYTYYLHKGLDLLNR